MVTTTREAAGMIERLRGEPNAACLEEVTRLVAPASSSPLSTKSPSVSGGFESETVNARTPPCAPSGHRRLRRRAAVQPHSRGRGAAHRGAAQCAHPSRQAGTGEPLGGSRVPLRERAGGLCRRPARPGWWPGSAVASRRQTRTLGRSPRGRRRYARWLAGSGTSSVVAVLSSNVVLLCFPLRFAFGHDRSPVKQGLIECSLTIQGRMPEPKTAKNPDTGFPGGDHSLRGQPVLLARRDSRRA